MPEQEINLFALWEYDLYPYTSGAVVTKMNATGLVYAPSYLGWFRPIRLLPVEEGEALLAKIKHLSNQYRAREEKLKEEYKKKLFEIMPYHPQNKSK